MLLLLPSLLILCSQFAAKGLAAESSTAAAYEAVYFYFGYLHEFAVHPGETTIGSRACRKTKCSFDEFFVNVIKGTGNGGYEGGVELDDGPKGNSALKMGEQLQAAGMTEAVDWDFPKLIVGASEKRGYEEILIYVSNRVRMDAGGDGSEDHVYAKVVGALHHIREAHAKDEMGDFEEELRELLPTDKSFKTKKLPEPDSNIESVGRTIIDLVNMFKVWAIEVPLTGTLLKDLEEIARRVQSAHGKTQQRRGFRNLQLGHALAGLTIAIQSCYKGEPYPPHLLPPNWY